MTDHDTHDLLRVAAHASGDTGRGHDEVARQVAECPACAALHADLRSLAVATRDLPVPIRPRDFTLTESDAARLRRWTWRRLLAPLAGPGFALARPVGAALATLGIAGLLVTALPANLSFDPAASPSERSMAPLAAAPGETPTEAQPGDHGAAGHRNDTAGALDTQGRTGASGGAGETAASVARRTTESTMLILAGSFVIAGLGLFGLRWAARRFGDG